MTPQLWVTLIVAILGALHGPLTSALITKRPRRKSTK